MHYKNGEAAKLGDFVKGTFYLPKGGGSPEWGQREAVGVLVGGSTSAGSCDAIVHVPEVKPAVALTSGEFIYGGAGAIGVAIFQDAGEAKLQAALYRSVTANCNELELVHRPA